MAEDEVKEKRFWHRIAHRFSGRGRIRSVFFLASLIFAKWNPVCAGIGLGVFIIGMIIHGVSKGNLVRNKQLCTQGPYLWVRHPFYVANFIIDIALCLMAGVPILAAVYAVAFPLAYLPRIFAEEEALRGYFGAAFDEYCKTTPRLFPRSIPRLIAWSRSSTFELMRLENEISRLMRLAAYPFFIAAVIIGKRYYFDRTEHNESLFAFCLAVALAQWAAGQLLHRYLEDGDPVRHPGLCRALIYGWIVVPFLPLLQDRVPFAAFTPSWVDGGGGIVYSFSPRPYQVGETRRINVHCGSVCVPTAVDPNDECLANLPPTGGSASWYLCEDRPFHTDSTDILTNAVINSAGEVLYIEMVGPTYFFPPLGSHAELWIGSGEKIAQRRLLFPLYRDSLGIVDRSRGLINWLEQIRWSGTRSFFALGQLKRSGQDSTIGIVRGVITATGADIAVIPGGAGTQITHFAPVENDAAVLFVDTTALVHRVDVATGAKTVFATIPVDTTARPLEITCHPGACVVLTRDGTPRHWDLWKLDLSTSAFTHLRTWSRAIGAAKLSPISGDVLILDGGNLYRYVKLVQ